MKPRNYRIGWFLQRWYEAASSWRTGNDKGALWADSSLLPQASLFLRQILRQFEHVLLQELGYAIDFSTDASQRDIQVNQHYQFQLNDGFLPVSQASRSTLDGRLIASMQSYEDGRDFSHEQLQLLGKLYRQMISALLGDRPLKSRQLWIQSTQT